MRSERTIYMRRMWKWGTVVVAATAAAACGSAEAENGDGSGSADAYVRIINVEVSPVEPQRFVEEIRLTSVAMANQDVLVAAEESGVIR
jgi:positive regulator of sigma E activity